MSTPKYFQGRTVTGQVFASEAQDFGQVVDKFKVAPVLGITRAAFLALPKEERNARKHVPFFTAACFTDSPSKRDYEHATHCNLIFLDIDPEKGKDGKYTGRYPAAPFVNDPDSLYTALGNLNFIAHTTASSTPERPHMRIVIDAREIPLHLYPQAVLTIGKMLGLPSVTPESKKAVQPMFLPTMFSDSTDEDHPLTAERRDGKQFLVETIEDVGEEDWDEPEPSANGKNGHSLNGNGKSPHTGPKETDSLLFLRAPVPEITLAIAREALEHIDPDCSYHQWIAIATALRHQFSPRQEDEAYEMFDEWSAKGSKYAGEQETKSKWASVRQTPVGRVPVTIRSLLLYATHAGWDDKKVAETCFDRLQTWMETVDTCTELVNSGVRRVMATPLLSPTFADMMVDQVRKQAHKRFGVAIQAINLRKEMQRIKEDMKAQERKSEKVKIPDWAKGVCYVAAPQDFYKHRTGEKLKAESFNSSFERHLLPTEKYLKETGLVATPAVLARPTVEPSAYLLNHIQCTTVYDYAYDPSQPTEMFFEDRGKRYVNTYSASYPELDSKRAAGAGELFQNHLRNLIGEPENRRTITDFMAFQVQSPGRKVRWAVLIQSVEGAGKTYLAEAMKKVLGVEHVKVIDGAAIKSGWNEWAFGNQMVVVEEVRVSGTNRHEIMNCLKPLITNDEIPIQEKFRNTRQIRNISNYMMFSNHHDALALTPGDRRYFVLKSPLQDKQQVLALGGEYFDALFGMLRDHPGAMRSYLMDWEISSDFNPDGHAPRTKYVTDMINDSSTDTAAAVRRLIDEGDHPLCQWDIVSAKQITDMLTLEEGLRNVTSQHLAFILREEGFQQVGRHLIGEERHYLWARAGIAPHEAGEAATIRVKRGLKNMDMKAFF